MPKDAKKPGEAWDMGGSRLTGQAVFLLLLGAERFKAGRGKGEGRGAH